MYYGLSWIKLYFRQMKMSTLGQYMSRQHTRAIARQIFWNNFIMNKSDLLG